MKSLVIPMLVASLAATGCATKKYVSREVGEVNEKVENLASDLERTQQRTQQNETRISEVGQRAESAYSGAEEAKGSAMQALSRATEAEKAAKGKLLYTVTLSNDKVTFPLNRAVVGEDAKKLVDETVSQLLAENRGVFFEIEGHTDATGPAEYNKQLGFDRAMAVRDYLHNQYGIALNRIEVISYGEEKPITDNKTRKNRAANRRVVVNILE
jgi:outer membrane protein OmpA-like peptidoglycan-associated protein